MFLRLTYTALRRKICQSTNSTETGALKSLSICPGEIFPKEQSPVGSVKGKSLVSPRCVPVLLSGALTSALGEGQLKTEMSQSNGDVSHSPASPLVQGAYGPAAGSAGAIRHQSEAAGATAAGAWAAPGRAEEAAG